VQRLERMQDMKEIKTDFMAGKRGEIENNPSSQIS
jgi:hypothetical protein